MTKMGDKRLSGGIPPAALGSAAAAASSSESKLSLARGRAAAGELVELPRYGTVWLQPLGVEEMEEIESLTIKKMAERGISQTPINSGSYNMRRFVYVMHRAARDPDDHSVPFGTLEEWQGEWESVVTGCIVKYMDTKRRLDPVGLRDASEEDCAEVTAAFKKKDATLLRSFDADILVSWLLTGVVQLASSPTPVSSTGERSAED